MKKICWKTVVKEIWKNGIWIILLLILVFRILVFSQLFAMMRTLLRPDLYEMNKNLLEMKTN